MFNKIFNSPVWFPALLSLAALIMFVLGAGMPLGYGG